MGKTLIEKIMQAHSDQPAHVGAPVTAGDIVWMQLDARTARDFGGANVVLNYRAHYDGAPVDDASKTFFTFDLVTPANNIPYAINQQICRDWAREQGVKVFDVDMGIGSHVALEYGLAWPGSTFVGTDSHLNILGAIGAFGQGMGDQDIAFTFKAGKTWFEVPRSMKVTVRGDLKPPCTAKDLTLACLRRLGASGALGQAVEFYGPAIEALNLAGRITLSSMMTEMGGIIGIIPPSEEVLAFWSGPVATTWLLSRPIQTLNTHKRSISTSQGWSRSSPARPNQTTSRQCARWLAPGSTRSLSAPAPMAALRISPPSQRWSRARRSRQAWSPRLCLPHARCMPRCSRAVCSKRCSTPALSSATPAAVAVPRDISAWLARARFRFRPATGTLPASRVLVTTT